MMCVYKITNMINGKVYIGQTINWEERRKQHIRAGKADMTVCKNTTYQMSLYDDMRKYGVENFVFEVIQEVETLDELDAYEIVYIRKYRSNHPKFGYNVSYGGHPTHRISAKQRKRLSESHKGLKYSAEFKNKKTHSVYMYDTKKSRIVLYLGGAKQVADEFGSDRTVITRCIRHGYMIRDRYYAFYADPEKRKETFEDIMESKRSKASSSRKYKNDDLKVRYIDDYVSAYEFVNREDKWMNEYKVK